MALFSRLASAFFLTAGIACAVPAHSQDVDPQDVPGMPNGMPPGLQAPYPEVQGGAGEVIPGRRARPNGAFNNNIPGATVIGPGGIIPQPGARPRRAEAPKPKALTPEERAAKIRKALAPKPSFSVSRRETLDKLYAKLAVASDADEAKGLATLINKIWLRSPSDTAALLMQRAMMAADKKDFTVALGLLDQIVETQPGWPEAWNKRASVRFLAGDTNGSMEDVEHVLKLDPNHFAALDGMGMILQRTGFDKRALQVYRRALAVYPHQPEIEELVKKLTLEVEGQGI